MGMHWVFIFLNKNLFFYSGGVFSMPHIYAKTISTKEMEQYYFTNRVDSLLPASGEVFLPATT